LAPVPESSIICHAVPPDDVGTFMVPEALSIIIPATRRLPAVAPEKLVAIEVSVDVAS